MSEPQQPPVPHYGQPSPAPQAAPQLPAAQPYPPQQPAQPYQQPAQPYQHPSAQPHPQSPGLDGAPQGYPGAAPQHFRQQQPGSEYPVPGYPGAGYPAPARPAASGTALGRTALIVALIAFAIGLLGAFLYPLLYGAFHFSYGLSYGIISGISGFLVLAGSTVALILGLMAIRRPGSPVLAGIAIGIAASEIAGTVISWISSLFYSLV